MSQNFSLTLSDPEVALAQWALQQTQAKLGADAPTTLVALIRQAFRETVLKMWQSEYAAATVVDVQGTLNNSDDEVKSTAVQALKALRKMTPEQQIAALQTVIDAAPVTP